LAHGESLSTIGRKRQPQKRGKKGLGNEKALISNLREEKIGRAFATPS